MACLVRYSTYSTYSMDPGGSGCSVGCLVRYSTYSTYSMDPAERVGGQRAQLCVFGQGGLTSPARVCARAGVSAPNCASLGKARAARVICMRSVGLLPGLCPNSSRPTSRATMAARQLARGVSPLPLSL